MGLSNSVKMPLLISESTGLNSLKAQSQTHQRETTSFQTSALTTKFFPTTTVLLLLRNLLDTSSRSQRMTSQPVQESQLVLTTKTLTEISSPPSRTRRLLLRHSDKNGPSNGNE